MTKEDYMQLSKERLAELLVERDHEPCITSPRQIRPSFLDCCGPNGVCTNPHRDCINCPKRGCGVVGTWCVTTTNGNHPQQK